MVKHKFDEFPNTVFEHYKNEKVIVKFVGQGFNIEIGVYKPGIYCNQNKGYAKCPVVQFKMNGELNPLYGKFFIFDNLVSKAISIVNKETRGVIRTDLINCFELGYEPDKIDYTKVDDRPIYIKQSDLKIGHIYMELNGRKSIYFGNCHLYREQPTGKFEHINKTYNGVHYSKFVYGSQHLIDIIQKKIKIVPIKVFTHDRAKEETIYNINIPDFKASMKFIDSFTVPRKYIADIGSIQLPEEAKFIKILDYGTLKNMKSECYMLITRENKSEQMKTDSFRLSEDGLETMISLAKEG